MQITRKTAFAFDNEWKKITEKFFSGGIFWTNKKRSEISFAFLNLFKKYNICGFLRENGCIAYIYYSNTEFVCCLALGIEGKFFDADFYRDFRLYRFVQL